MKQRPSKSRIAVLIGAIALLAVALGSIPFVAPALGIRAVFLVGSVCAAAGFFFAHAVTTFLRRNPQGQIDGFK